MKPRTATIVMGDVGDRKTRIVIEVIPHPRSKGDWQVRCEQLLPWPIWFKDRKQAISYAEWLGRGYDFEVRLDPEEPVPG